MSYEIGIFEVLVSALAAALSQRFTLIPADNVAASALKKKFSNHYFDFS